MSERKTNTYKFRCWDKKKKEMSFDVQNYWNCDQCQSEYGMGVDDDDYDDVECFGDFLVSELIKFYDKIQKQAKDEGGD